MKTFRSIRIHNLKHRRSATLGGKDMRIMKFKYEESSQFLFYYVFKKLYFQGPTLAGSYFRGPTNHDLLKLQFNLRYHNDKFTLYLEKITSLGVKILENLTEYIRFNIFYLENSGMQGFSKSQLFTEKISNLCCF